MDLGKLRLGEWLAAVSAVALLAVMFLPWFSLPLRGITVPDGDPTVTDPVSAWGAFTVWDFALACFAGMGLGLAALTATRRSPAAPIATAVVTAAVGIVLAIALFLRLIFPPGPNEVTDVRYGAWLGLLCVLAVTAGAWYVMRDERTEAIDPPFVPAQPAPPATAPAGSRVAEGRVPEADDRS